MHVSSVRVRNFRCFEDTTVQFRPGLNVITGENNAGKTALLTALRLVFDRGSVRLTSHDVHHAAFEREEPPTITVTITLASDPSDTPEDRAVVATWLTRAGNEWEASLSFVYELPADHHDAYLRECNSFDGVVSEKSRNAFERLERRYTSRFYGGELSNRMTAEPEWLSHFQAHHLDAIRDATQDLHSGRATLLRGMLRRVLDTHPPVPGAEVIDDAARERRLTDRIAKQNEFRSLSQNLVSQLMGRLQLDHLFGMATRNWGRTAGKPSLNGRMTEHDLLDALLLHLDRGLYQHPVTHGGLGYNNLLYVAIVLASLAPASDDEIHQESPFNTLFVEEPEAHLHPALQYRFLCFLRRMLDDAEPTKRPGSRQLFLSTHSTQVTSAVGLDALVCLHLDDEGVPKVAYPGRSFPDTPEGHKSKAYVERFLDATKSELLFARSVVLVEGIAEQLLLPQLADFVLNSGEEPNLLARNYVAVVQVNGVTFHHFLPLFGIATDLDRADYGLRTRRVACLIDGDPSRANGGDVTAEPQDLDEAEDGPKKRRACYPYQTGATPSAVSANLLELVQTYSDQLVVGVSEKTFEYDLAHANHTAEVLVTDAMPARAAALLRKLCTGEHSGSEPQWAAWRPKASAALTAFLESGIDPEECARARFATYYLCAAKDAKGDHASALAAILDDHLSRPHDAPERVRIALPGYIETVLRWVCNHETPECWASQGAETAEAL